MNTSPIRRLLVANRGEIARRIFRTARTRGIVCIAVFADGDTKAPFVRESDLAVALEGASAAETYLDVAKVLDAARRCRADAIHPGYGFLSENEQFASAVLEAGIRWVGPAPGVIAAMGDKLAAKRLMAAAGVPTLPWVEISVERSPTPDEIDAVGFPLLVKAVAGGGGRGMRIVQDRDSLDDALAAARRESGAAFGDDRVFLERYLAAPRHIEVQVLADSYGEIIHCFERECSVQRRYQKVIEEAPSPAVDTQTRSRLGELAVAAAKAVDYVGAGTVEFVMDGDGHFWFLEMNTRLQVEHPVTEMITGLDLVDEQLRIAGGEHLAHRQPSLDQRGWAIEARLCAEDPTGDFLPTGGTMLMFDPPDLPGLRIDSGVESGTPVNTNFDPMLAKFVATADTRDDARRTLVSALRQTRMHGVVTNRDLLVSILEHDAFRVGETRTDFITKHDMSRPMFPDAVEIDAATAAVALARLSLNRAGARVQRTLPPGWRNSVMPPQDLRLALVRHGLELRIRYIPRRDGSVTMTIDDRELQVRLHSWQEDILHLEIERIIRSVRYLRRIDRWWIQLEGTELEFLEISPFPSGRLEAALGGLTAPMPGTVISIDVSEGQTVSTGEQLFALEAMKMEHRICAPEAGVVTEINVRLDQAVESGTQLAVLKPDAPEDQPPTGGSGTANSAVER